jgi:hypothetical protein
MPIDEIVDELDRLRRQIDALHSQLDHATSTAVEYGREATRLRGELGRAQYAVDCAIILINALVIFIPNGTVLHPGVGVAQAKLDRALHALQQAEAEPAQ